MKTTLFLKSTLLTTLFLLSSCATTNYSEDLNRNNYTNLKSGGSYTFTLKDGSKKQKMIFTKIEKDNIVGLASKKDSSVVSLSKSNVSAVKDNTKSAVTTGAIVIGGAAVAALVLSATRASN